MDDERDPWEQVGQTPDWVAGCVASWVRREPADLVWPTIALGLASGLAAEALNAATGAVPALVWIGIALTLSGYGMLGLLAQRFRGSGGGGARTAEREMLAPWLRRLQVLMSAAMAAVVGLLVLGAVTGSWLLVARNTLELGRVGGIVLAVSFLLLDDEVGLPDWLARRVRDPGTASAGS